MRQINVRFPDDLHGQLAEAAEADRRSINSEVLWLIEKGLTWRDAQPDSTPA